MQIRRVFALPLMLAALVGVAAGHDAAKGLRFNSPDVTDLARHAPLLDGKSVRVVALETAVAAQILAAPPIDQEHATLPFSDYTFGCAADSKTCVPQHEQQLIAASASAVRRDHKWLAVKPGEAPAAVFVDWTEPTTKTADGDSETHWYLGTLTGNGFHQVEVQFGHDAPGSFLINPKNGRTAFVHIGSDIVALSPDNSRLVTFNPDNPPLTLRVALLDGNGPNVELECTAGADDRSVGQFKGWHDAQAFDLALQPAHNGANVALRIANGKDGWAVAADAKALAAAGFACRQGH
jgi:hypothetical protein